MSISTPPMTIDTESVSLRNSTDNATAINVSRYENIPVVTEPICLNDATESDLEIITTAIPEKIAAYSMLVSTHACTTTPEIDRPPTSSAPAVIRRPPQPQ